MLKKIGIVIGVILLVIVCVIGGLYLRAMSMANNVITQYENIQPVNMAKVADGVYTGSFSDFLVAAKVQVTVKRHRITEIKLVDQRCGPGYEAVGTTDRILKAQSPKVDAVTGASGSSKTIMIAVYRALTGK